MNEEIQDVQIEQVKQEAPEQPQQLSDKEINLRNMREQLEQERYMRMKMEEQLKQYAAPKQEEPEINYFDDIDDENYVDGRKLKKLAATLMKELSNSKKELKEIKDKTSVSTAEVRLNRQFSDFDKVVTNDTMAKFAQLYPEEYSMLANTPDLYSRGKGLYNMIKNFGVAPNNSINERRFTESKAAIPKSSANAAPQVETSPLANLGQYDRRTLTEEDKAKLRREMSQYSK